MARKVLFIIDVQKGFVENKATAKVVDLIVKHLKATHYDLIIQSRWENYMGSQYETQLGYTAVGNSAETDMLIKGYDDHVITRTVYSCVTDKTKRLLRHDDEIFLCGLETDACVLGTCFGLWDNDYRNFHVIEKLTATCQSKLHEPALQIMRRQFGKASVV